MSFLRTLSPDDRLHGDVAALFAARVEKDVAPGSYFAVFDDQGLVFEGAAGRRNEAGGAPDRHTRFRIASCTKSFTSAALLVLRDRGALALDEPVTQYVPALRPTLPETYPAAPTLRMLMSMSGGLPTDDPWADRQESLTREAFDSVLATGVRFSTIPGSRYEYSNLGYALLGQVIERVSGLSYWEFVSRELLAPLGLSATTFDFTKAPEQHLATGFRRSGVDWLALPFTGPGAFSSIGGAISCGADLMRWAAWLSEAFHPDHPERGPLSAASRREMQTIHCPIVPEAKDTARLKGYGFGLIAEDRASGRTISHSGGYPGFSSHMRWHPASRIGIVAFENGTYSGAWEPAAAAIERMLEALQPAVGNGAPAPDQVRRLADALLSAVRQRDMTGLDGMCLENVALDEPWTERNVELAAVLDKAGSLDLGAHNIVPKDAMGYGSFELRIPCGAGVVVGAMQFGPPEPARLQTLGWSLEPKPA